MSDKTGIEWTDATWNPVTGCSKVSQGCKNCYALRDWKRFSSMPNTVYFGREFTDVMTHRDRLAQPIRWKRPRMIFVNSMSDLFHEDVPDEFIDCVFAVMAIAEQHTFQVLTKRPARMRQYMASLRGRTQLIAKASAEIPDSKGWGHTDSISEIVAHRIEAGPLPNVWLGVSVEDQTTAEARVPELLQTPAAVHWISAEPMLGPVDLSSVQGCPDTAPQTSHEHARLDWLVCGGESGPRARPCHPAWVKALRDQCRMANVPFLFKQWGEWLPLSELPPDAHRALYRSNKLAADGESQALLDEMHGRTCKVETTAVGINGSLGFDQAYLNDGMQCFRVGKRKSGRLLAGQQHDGYPSIEKGARTYE